MGKSPVWAAWAGKLEKSDYQKFLFSHFPHFLHFHIYMSHIPERKEKDCLNCGTIVHGKYCHKCGQENVVPKETFWHMVTHMFYDITHFDSNFFHTVHHLVLKPGFLSKEYMAGKRARYLHPIKMYVFTSAIFFLLFFSFFSPKTQVTDTKRPLDEKERKDYAASLENQIKKDSTNEKLRSKLTLLRDSTYTPTLRDAMDINEDEHLITISDRNYKTVVEYDSIQQTFPKKERDGWLMQRIMKRVIEINTKYREQPEEALRKLGDTVLHRLPYMLFVSLPLFALILKLVYARRKQFFYADHGVFTLHLYIFSFILLLVVFLISSLQNWTGWSFLDFFYWALFIWLFSYLFLAMRKFYGQARGKTFVKFILVTILSLVMMLFLLLFFSIFSAFTL